MTLANCPGASPCRELAHRPLINPCPSTHDQDEEPTGCPGCPGGGSGAGALRAGLHHVEPEGAVVVGVYQRLALMQAGQGQQGLHWPKVGGAVPKRPASSPQT